jgi:transposase
MATLTSYPSDVSDEEWAVAVPYLTLLVPTALQRNYELRAVFNAVRYLAHTGAPWRYLPSDFPPWAVVYQQVRRWLAAGSFEALVQDARLLLRACCCALAAARPQGQKAAAQRSDRGRTRLAIDAGEREPGGLQWGQTA